MKKKKERKEEKHVVPSNKNEARTAQRLSLVWNGSKLGTLLGQAHEGTFQ
jgi:hypothetical protein